ncbi:hypothetical protein [Streptomyces yangpuensis]|uniref:hypothetical protein n=1 Tax=Streptomyces yangpuensis TaxID=1648182 RepID=UPI0037186B3E
MAGRPFFDRSEWEGNRCVHDDHDPAGLMRIVITPIIAAGVAIWLLNSSRWSEAELRTAVHQGAEELDGSIQYVSPDTTLGTLIRDTVDDSGTGPGHGLDVARDGFVDGEHRYTISTDDTDKSYCIRITMSRVNTDNHFPLLRQDHRLSAAASEGAC